MIGRQLVMKEKEGGLLEDVLWAKIDKPGHAATQGKDDWKDGLHLHRNTMSRR